MTKKERDTFDELRAFFFHSSLVGYWVTSKTNSQVVENSSFRCHTGLKSIPCTTWKLEMTLFGNLIFTDWNPIQVGHNGSNSNTTGILTRIRKFGHVHVGEDRGRDLRHKYRRLRNPECQIVGQKLLADSSSGPADI